MERTVDRNNLSFSRIREIMVIDDAFERFFYETECIKCNWSVSAAKNFQKRVCN